MQTIHDDLPHPVPPSAYMRYKENWFFIVIAPESGVMGMAHFNYEPVFDRARMSCNLLVNGKLHQYANAIPFPKDYAYAPQIGDGRLTIDFVAPHEAFRLGLDSDALKVEIDMKRRAPTFNFEAADAANPDRPTAKEIMGLATNQIFEHQQQALTVSGTVTVKETGEKVAVSGLGYRDHSRAVRSDNITHSHYWTCLQFDDTVIGLMALKSIYRPELWHYSGYVNDAKGTRALRGFEIEGTGETADRLPETVRFGLTDVFGEPFTVVADVANRHGYVPLNVEAASTTGLGYRIFENFVPLRREETGEAGISLLEIGYSTLNGEPQS